MDPFSIAVSGASFADNLIRPLALKIIGSERRNTVKVLRTCLVPTVDIVFIANLNQDPIFAWTAEKFEKSVNWVKDILPSQFPTARLLLFKYGIETRTPEAFTKRAVFSQAYDLLEDLWARRRGIAERRPLIFVTHDLGGLIAKSALIQSSAALTGNVKHLKSIYLSTSGLLVFDAVHSPLHLSQSWKDLLDHVMSNRHYINKSDISVTRSSRWLEWQMDRFKPIASRVNTITMIPIDGAPTSKPSRARKVLTWLRYYNNAGFLGSHSKIVLLSRSPARLVKFSSLNDEGFHQVISNIQDLIVQAQNLVDDKWRLEDLQRQVSTNVPQGSSFDFRPILWTLPEELEKFDYSVIRVGEVYTNSSVNNQDEAKRPSITVAGQKRSISLLLQQQEKRNELEKGIRKTTKDLRSSENMNGFLNDATLERLEKLSQVYLKAEELETSESVTQRLLISQIMCHGMKTPEALKLIERIASIKNKQSRYTDAAAYLALAIELRSELPHNKDYREDIDRSWVDLAILLDKQERYREAGSIYARVLQSRKDFKDNTTLQILDIQALHYWTRGDMTKAKRNYENILMTLESDPKIQRGSRSHEEWKEIVQQKLDACSMKGSYEDL